MHIIEGLDTVKELPNGIEIDLFGIKEYNDITEKQRLVLSHFFDVFPQKTLACLRAGTSVQSFYEWLQDENFAKVYELIKSLHREALSEVQYKDSYKNPTIRSGTLKALDAEGYERRDRNVNHTHNTLVLQGSIEDVIKQLPKR